MTKWRFYSSYINVAAQHLAFLSLFIVQSSHSKLKLFLITSGSLTSNLQTFIMATQNPNPEPSEHFSFNETATSYPVLEIKNNNLYLNLETFLQTRAKYFDSSFKSIFVCLKHSKISHALTLTKSVLISVLSRAYATARCDKSTESMHFNLSSDACMGCFV